MATMEADSVDSLVTDPPYNLGFMGSKWDRHSNYQQWSELWGRQALRVLKPGAHALVFGSPRTYHRIACGLEDAGFEVRDCLMWLFGEGMPKSHNIAIRIDKLHDPRPRGKNIWGSSNYQPPHKPQSPEAQQWAGWGTNLKPSYEPVVLLRKPFPGTTARNVLGRSSLWLKCRNPV